MVFLQVAKLSFDQWSVSCSTSIFFKAEDVQLSGQDWFSCESQQSPSYSSSSVTVEFAVWKRTFCQSVCSWHCLWVRLKLLHPFAVVSNKAFKRNGGEHWFPPQLCSGLQVRRSMWEAATAVNEPCFGPSEPLFSQVFHPDKSHHISSTPQGHLGFRGCLDRTFARTIWVFLHLCLMPDVNLKSASHL